MAQVHSSAIAMPRRARRRGTSVVALAALALLTAGEAPAEPTGLLETLFGPLARPPRFATPPALPATPAPRTDRPPVSITITPRRPARRHGIAGYCVRLCDGRYFPLPAVHEKAGPEKMCEALCPTAQTRVYWGADIAWSRASNGSRYQDLETAFRYRSELARGCTCNGRDSLGTAAISLAADFTLQPGDIVALDNGFSVYVGGDDKLQSAHFVPVTAADKLSDEFRQRLADAQIVPPPIMLDTHPLKRLTVETRITVGFAPFDAQPAESPPATPAPSWIQSIPGRG